MLLPSLSTLVTRASESFRRFPASMVTAFFAAFLLLSLVGLEFNDNDPIFFSLMNGVLVCSVALTVFTALSLFSDVRQHTSSIRYLLQAGALLLLVWYYYGLPHGDYSRYEILRFMIYNFCGHLLVAFLPYAGKQEYDGFWAYNKSLFIRILTSALYSAVLFGGLAIALLAIDNLFDVDLDEKNFARLFIIISVVFNTWFFLSGTPVDFVTLNETPEYPKGLKIFTQYVLLPIITIYMVILYAYMGKIIISGVWPEGWVSWLVLCFSVAGILALLLIWPVRNDEGNTWMRIYAKGFYFALFPLVIMLFLSIRIRVLEYGITEGRYYVVLLALWLAVMAAYFLISKIKSIKVIPLSLFIMGILSVHGPWSAFSVSKHSQMDLLVHFLEQNKMIQDGKVVPATGQIQKSDQLEIQEKVEYLNEFHGYQTMQPLFTQDLDSVMVPDSGYRYVNETDRILALMNLPRISRYGNSTEPEDRYFTFETQTGQPVDISGYSYFVNMGFGDYREKSFETKKMQFGSRELSVTWHLNASQLEFADGDSLLSLNVDSTLRSLFNSKKGEYNRVGIAPSEMTLEGNLNGLRIKVLLRSINGKHKVATDEFITNNVRMDILTGE